MILQTVACYFLALSSCANLARPSKPAGYDACPSVLHRREWRDLDRTEQADYIRAVQCLHEKPSQTSLMGDTAKTRFDDFLALHISLTDEIHGVGQFLPWHRRFLNVYERALREECAYAGAQPYWDQTLDLPNFASSPLFDPLTGFGGNGLDVPGSSGPWNNLSFIGGFSGGGCVTDGPFASYNLSVGPGTLSTNHCLTRGFNSVALNFIGPNMVESMQASDGYAQFRVELEGTPSAAVFKIHDAGHLAIAGEMCDRYSSPADPLFYMHHTNLDRHWWNWQQANLAQRLVDMTGVAVQGGSENVTLDYPLKMDVLAPQADIRSVMDVRTVDGGCYAYVDHVAPTAPAATQEESHEGGGRLGDELVKKGVRAARWLRGAA